jgi:predicted phosphodiesterase
LKDLIAGRRYNVRVGIPSAGETFLSPGLNGEPWGELTLETLPQNVDHLTVAVIGDSGFGEQITYALAAQIAAREPDFMIHTGDMVYSAFENGTPLRAYQAKYYWPFKKVLLTAPVYAVPGNHEYYDDASLGGLPYYFEIFPPIETGIRDGTWIGSGQEFRNWFAVRLMDYQFLFLESQGFYRPEGVSEQTEWLSRMLTEHEGPSIVTYHIATYTSGRHGRDGLPIQSTWVPLLDQADTVLVLSGHDHNYERLNVNGIEYIVSGGGSRKLYSLEEPVEGSKVFATQSHFVLLDIYPDRIEIESINAFGDVLDRATLSVSP